MSITYIDRPVQQRVLYCIQISNAVQVAPNGAGADSQLPYDPFSMSAVGQAIPTTQYNPYLEETNNLANNGATYFPSQPTYTAPAQPVSFTPPLFYARKVVLTLPAPIPSIRSNRTT